MGRHADSYYVIKLYRFMEAAAAVLEMALNGRFPCFRVLRNRDQRVPVGFRLRGSEMQGEFVYVFMVFLRMSAERKLT